MLCIFFSHQRHPCGQEPGSAPLTAPRSASSALFPPPELLSVWVEAKKGGRSISITILGSCHVSVCSSPVKSNQVKVMEKLGGGGFRSTLDSAQMKSKENRFNRYFH